MDNSADSICSDDTEYLLGQNVSLRDIDDYEEKTQRGISPKQRGQYNNHLSPQQYTETASKNTQHNRKYKQTPKHEHIRADVSHSRPKTIELTSQNSQTLKKPVKDNIKKAAMHVNGGASQQSSHTVHKIPAQMHSSQTKQPNKQVTNYNMKNGTKNEHVQSGKKKESKLEWRDKMSAANHDQSWDWNQANDRQIYLSPEQADAVSVHSEAATEELLKDEELDGSIIQKLKELNLAVNYDPDTDGKINVLYLNSRDG